MVRQLWLAVVMMSVMLCSPVFAGEADVDRAVRFYVETLGGTVSERFERDGVQWARVRLAGTMLNVTVRASADLRGVAVTEGGNDTTHFSIVDADGNLVAATLSVNYPFGSGLIADGTGVLLNDEMDDFSASPGVPNVWGLLGTEANAIAPGKRMLSSMTPAFVHTPQRSLVTGTPGGSWIITMNLLGILEFLNGGNAEAIV